MISEKEWQNLRPILDDAAGKCAVSEYEITVIEEISRNADALREEISGYQDSVSQTVSLRVVCKGKRGAARGTDTSPEALSDLLFRAAEIAGLMDEIANVGFYGGAEEYPDVVDPVDDLPGTAECLCEALSLQKKVFALDKNATEATQTSVSVLSVERAIMNSHGLYLRHKNAGACAVQEAVVTDGKEFAEAFRVKKLSESSTVPEECLAEAHDKLTAIPMTVGKCDVVFTGKAFSNLLSVLKSAFSGKEVLYGTSRLAGKLGEKIASERVTVIDAPFMKDSLAAIPFDAEGVPRKEHVLIDRGVLKTFLYNREIAEKVGVESTGNAVGSMATCGIAPAHLYIAPGEKTTEELIASCGEGVLVTELKGLHASTNAVSGDFSIASAGYRIENGKKANAVKGFTVAGNFFELLAAVEDVSDDLYFGPTVTLPSIGSPDLLVRGMMLAGE